MIDGVFSGDAGIVSRETVIPIGGGEMAHWRKELFSTMVDLASSVVDYFKIPPNRVIELGTRHMLKRRLTFGLFNPLVGK